jgi:hypothetical protein
MKSVKRPYIPDWQSALIHARAARRCHARCRVSKKQCGQPAMRGKRVCRPHGGKGGGPKGERKGAYRTGCFTAEARAECRQVRMLIRCASRLKALLSTAGPWP